MKLISFFSIFLSFSFYCHCKEEISQFKRDKKFIEISHPNNFKIWSILPSSSSSSSSSSSFSSSSSSSFNSNNIQIKLFFAFKQNNINLLKNLLLTLSNSSLISSYGRYYTLEQINQLTKPNNQIINKVISYLKLFNITKFEFISNFLSFESNLNIVESLLSTKYYQFYNIKTGEVIIRCLNYSLPDDIAEHISFVSPTVNFPKKYHIVAEKYKSKRVLNSDFYQNTPESLRLLYNIGDAFGGKSILNSQAVTAFLEQYYSEKDLQTFYSNYFPKLQGTPISKVIGPNGENVGLEASIDVEYMTSIGSGVRTEFWSFDGTQLDNVKNEPFLDWLYLLGNTTNPPYVFSTSYAEDESSVSEEYANRMNEEFLKNSLRGITFLFASGDNGVGSYDGSCVKFEPKYPADSPYVTAVGATTQLNPEIGASLSSGGFSYRWDRPEWQNDAIENYLKQTNISLPSTDLFNKNGRGFPDVSAQGTNYVVINNGVTFSSVDGTSCACPTFGGIISLLNDVRLSQGKSPLGFLNPFLYSNPSIFNDIIEGNNPGCGTNGFYATNGWDPVTGLGTPNYTRMLEAVLALP